MKLTAVLKRIVSSASEQWNGTTVQARKAAMAEKKEV